MADEDLGGVLNNLKADAESWKNRGNTLFKERKYQDALECYENALKIDPTYYDALNNKGITLIKLGRIDEARQINEKLIQLKTISKEQDIPADISSESGKFCQNCGSRIQYTDAEICPRCGVRIQNLLKGDAPQTDRKPFWLGLIGLIFGILAGIFVILAMGFLSYFVGGNASQNWGTIGWIAIILCLIGFLGSIVKHKQYGGVIMILAGIFILILIGGFGLITGPLYIVAGFLILRKTGFKVLYFLNFKEDTIKKIFFTFLIVFSILLLIGGLQLHEELSPSANVPNIGTSTSAGSLSASPGSRVPSPVLSSVTHGSLTTLSQNWDADAEDDGIIIYPDLKDAQDRTIQWSGAELPVEIEIYTTKFDSKFKLTKGDLVYSGTGKITSWRDGNMFAGGGIKIPFEDINAGDENSGITLVRVSLPDGRTIESEFPFTSLKAS